MPTQSLFHNTPTFSTRNINANSPTSLPSPYNSPILASDLMAFPAGGIKNANTLDELRRALNQLAKDKKAYLDKLQVQVTNNDGDITIIDTNLTEIQADLENVARDLSRKAWESITIVPGIGLSAPHGVSTTAAGITGNPTGVSIAGDLQLDLDVALDNELGGVLSNDAQTITNSTVESAITGHIEVDGVGNVKIKDNAIELGAKTRGDYIHNITATPADGITLTGGTGEKTTTDLKLTDIHSGASEQLATVADGNVTGHAMPADKIRRVTLHIPTRDKFGRITSDSPLKINSANDKNLKVLVTDGLNITAGSNLGASTSKSATFKQNKGSNQDFTINHSPAVGTLADTTFTTGIPSSGYGDYSPGFAAGTGKINFPETLGQLTFDTFGHVKQVTKRTLTYGLNSPLPPIDDSTEPYSAGNGANFDLNIPTEADFANLVERVLTLQGNRVLIPPNQGNIQLERDVDVTGSTGGSGALTVASNLNVGSNKFKVDVSTSRVGINKSNPGYSLDVVGNGRFSTDLAVGDDIFLGSAIHHTGDTNTKIEFVFEDTIDLATAGSSRIRITGDGKIGIGATAPKNKLQVRGSSDDVISASFSGGIEVANTVHSISGGNRAFGFLSISDSATMVGGNLRLDDSVTTGTHVGYANGTNDRGGAGIIFENANDDSRGEIKFVQSNDTNDDTYTVLERMTIDHLGRVGIGTSTPAARLHVKAPTPGNPNLQGSTLNSVANSPSAIFDTTVVCEGNLVVKGDFNLQNGITFDQWSIQENTGNVTAGGTQNFTNSLDSSSTTTGAVKTAGGLGVAKNLNVGKNTQLGDSPGRTVGLGGNHIVFGKMGGDNTYGIAYAHSNTTAALSNSPNSDRWRIYQSDRMPTPAIGETELESIHIDGEVPESGTADYMVFEKQDGNYNSGTGGGMDGGFAFISNGRNKLTNVTSSKKHFRIKYGGAKFYDDLEVAGNLSIAGGLTTTGSSGLTLTGDTSITANLTVNGHTTLGNDVNDITTISGDFTAGNSASTMADKLHFDSSAGRLGIGKTNPSYSLDVAGHGRFVGDVISSGSSGAEFTASYGSGKVMRLLHGSGYGVVGTTGATSVGIRTNDTDRIRITETGKVGIGTTSPNANYALTVNGATRSEGNIFQGGADFDLNNSPRRTLTSGSDTTHEEPSSSSRRRALVHNFGDRLEINYAGDYTGGLKVADKFQFTNTGELGVGTLDPDCTMEVVNTSEAKIAVRSSNGTSDAILQLCTGSTSTGNADWTIRLDNDDGDQMEWRWDNAHRMSLTTDGKLGIGIDDPDYKLDVAGSQRLTSGAPELVFKETGHSMGFGLSGGYFRTMVNGSQFKINRNTHSTVPFATSEDVLKVHSNGNLSLGEPHLENDEHYMDFVKKDPVSNSHIQTHNELFFMGQANTFVFDGRFRDACASFGVTESGIDITPFNSDNANYKGVTSVGDGTTRIGIVLRRDAANFEEDGETIVENPARGGIIYASRDRGGSLILNRNISGGTQIYFNNDGERTALIGTGTPGNNPFELLTRSENDETQRKRIVVYKDGSIIHSSQTYMHDESSDIDDDPSAVLHLRSHSSDHIRFENSTGGHLATIDMDETNGLFIETNTSKTGAKVIRLRPDNNDRMIMTGSHSRFLHYVLFNNTKDAIEGDNYASINTEGGAQIKKRLWVSYDGDGETATGRTDKTGSAYIKGDAAIDGDIYTDTLDASRVDATRINASGVINGGVTQHNLTVGAPTTTTINLGTSNTHKIDVNASAKLAFSGVTAGASYTLIFTNKGNYDIDFSGNWYFTGGEPTLTQGAGKIDLMSFISDGTNLYGGISPDLTKA